MASSTVGTPMMQRAPVALPASAPLVVTTSTAPPFGEGIITDACSVSPAFRAWVECLVEGRVDQAVRRFADAQGVSVTASASASIIAAEQVARQRLGSEVKILADAQVQMLAVVESLSGDHQRQCVTTQETRTEALSGVKKMMDTVDELHRILAEDGDGASARHRDQTVLITEVQRSQADEAARSRAAISDMQHALGETSTRQRQCNEELAQLRNTITGTQQEVRELTQALHRLDAKLTGWCTDVAAEVADEIRNANQARHAEAEEERQQLDMLHQEITSATTARIEIETRLENLRSEIAKTVDSRIDLEDKIRLEHQATETLARRVEALRESVAEDMEVTKEELDGLALLSQRLDARLNSLRDEVVQELHSASARHEASLREQTNASHEGIRREVITTSQLLCTAEDRLERMQVELATHAATRDTSEFRHRESYDDLRRALEVAQASIREEFGTHQRKLLAEVRAETRAFMKSEQNSIAALDEQLWLTDQRLGQRLDELVQSAARNDQRVNGQGGDSVSGVGCGRFAFPTAPPTWNATVEQRPVIATGSAERRTHSEGFSDRCIAAHAANACTGTPSPSSAKSKLSSIQLASEAATAFADFASIGGCSTNSPRLGLGAVAETPGAPRRRCGSGISVEKRGHTLSDTDQLERLRNARRNRGHV
eukprot:TRINITY_DN40762_c0_g1_i1.p1 TRINITY_DN40762_c0_g1~~TRINITY_DN40762_c0_g1_i1.p1  ORF type:complete len:663 (+),score=118.50 TRINITY_DN40762_c0_g1_i1:52-2040(+)